MKNFVTEIAINDNVHEFYFKRERTAIGKRYNITVADQNMQLYRISMELQNDRWDIVDAQDVPRWIQDAAHRLRNAILANEGM